MNARALRTLFAPAPAFNERYGPPLADPVYGGVMALRAPGALEAGVRDASVRSDKMPRVSQVYVLQTRYRPYARAHLVAEINLESGNHTPCPYRQVVYIEIYSAHEQAHEEYSRSSMNEALRCYGAPVFVLEDPGAVVWSLPNGPKLESIRLCFDRSLFAQFLVHNGLTPAWSDVAPELPELIRYVPRKRALFRYQATGNGVPVLYIKFYGRGEDARAAHNLQRLTEAAAQGRLGFQTPRLILHAAQSHAVAMTEVPGTRLSAVVRTASQTVFAAVGRALGGLHASPIRPGLAWTVQGEIQALYCAMADVKLALPGLKPMLDEVLQQIVVRQERLDFGVQLPIHANLFGDQILIDGATVGIVDWDDLALGDPLYDVGRLIAHLVFIAQRSRTSPAEVTRHLRTLMQAYAETAKGGIAWERLRWHIAVALLLRAKISALRQLPSGWIEDIRWSVAEAARVLEDKSPWLPT